MKTPYLDSHHDAEMRLNKTIVMHNGRPVFIQRIVGQELDVMATDLITNEDVELPSLKGEGWDFTPVQLGYVNFPRRDAGYVQRTPARRWKQGLDCGALHFPEHMLTTPALARTILNKYPSFQAAVNRAEGFGVRTAFHKDWSVNRYDVDRYLLEYRNRKVGVVRPDLTFELKDKYIFLQEALQEAINHV